jgi:sirohydrochlorin ferrochelatase
VADTIKSEIKESLVPATEEMLSVVVMPHGSDLAGLLRQFPEIADLLREATGSSSVEPTTELNEPERDSHHLDQTEPILTTVI